jgi:hypothetical protein
MGQSWAPAVAGGLNCEAGAHGTAGARAALADAGETDAPAVRLSALGGASGLRARVCACRLPRTVSRRLSSSGSTFGATEGWPPTRKIRPAIGALERSPVLFQWRSPPRRERRHNVCTPPPFSVCGNESFHCHGTRAPRVAAASSSREVQDRPLSQTAAECAHFRREMAAGLDAAVVTTRRGVAFAAVFAATLGATLGAAFAAALGTSLAGAFAAGFATTGALRQTNDCDPQFCLSVAPMHRGSTAVPFR